MVSNDDPLQIPVVHKPSSQRMQRDEFYLRIARMQGERATCPRARGGTVVTVQNRIVSTGYAGAPTGLPHCFDVGCEIGEDDPGCRRTVHAEISAITFAARWGVSVAGGTLYTTYSPCYTCAKALINAGIAVVVYEIPYRDPHGLELLISARITLRYFPLPSDKEPPLETD